MRRATLHFGVFLCVWTTCVRAYAHGVPPDAYAILAQDATGPLAVSLSAGVALRRSPQSYQFVCPMLWGDQFAAPVAALADGTIVVGATKGLMLLGQDGTLRPHPDPAAVGRSSDVVRTTSGVFSLRATSQGSELLAVDAQQVRVLWRDTNTLYSLAASGDTLVLLRGMDTMLQQVTLSAADGSELERQTATLTMPVDNVYARANAGVAYAVLVYRNGTIALGSLSMNAFHELAEGELSIAGPLTTNDLTLIALDGKLEQLVGDQMLPLTDDHNVVCLAQNDALTYACESHGIAHVTGPALAEPLFRFEWLAAPDLTGVPDMDDRFLCNSQWQDLRFDMNLIAPDALSATFAAAMAGAGAGTGAAGAQLMAAGVGGQLMAASAMAGAGAGGQAGAAVMPPQQVQTPGTSCATLPEGRGSYAPAFFAVSALALWSRRRRRGHKTRAADTIFDRF